MAKPDEDPRAPSRRSSSSQGSDDRRADRFTDLYDRYADVVLGYALRRTDDAAAAADVVADTFLVAWRRLDEVPATEDARPWLFGTARRVLANHRRGRRRAHKLEERVEQELRAGIANVIVNQPLLDVPAIREAFGSLSEMDREILTLVGVEGFGPAEVATVVQCSRVAARVRIHRARQRFTRLLSERGIEV